MPRIDPIQLLNCLSVLLSPDGGIKSRDEVQRLASLMTKFSKKLVSKCIYIQILKCTETRLLGLFMCAGGWRLVHMWLTESIVAKNFPLVQELLELLLLCPVDIERLKTNNCPKLVKELSKDGNHFAVRALASKIVEQWLKIVKGENVSPLKPTDLPKIINDALLELNSEENITEETDVDSQSGDKSVDDIKTEDDDDEVKEENISEDGAEDDGKVSTIKKEDEEKPEVISESKDITLPDQGDIESKPTEKSAEKDKITEKERKSEKDKTKQRDKSKEKHKSKHKDKSASKSSSSSSKSTSKSSTHSSSSDKHKSSHSSSSKDKSKDKDRHSSSSKSKHSENNSKKSDKTDKTHSSSSRSKENKDAKGSEKDKNKDKNKETAVKPPTEKPEQKPEPPSIQKLGKIPKLSDVKREKPSISIEVRKPDEPKPKTVKTFHSKFRKHGLEEEIKPPPSRAALLNKKVTPSIPPIPATIQKRPSPVHNEIPPEKKPKTIEIVEKPGAIKLIPPKPKPVVLLESGLFMDALNASATNKKEPKKRKRRTSGSKDGNAPGDNSPPQTPTTISSPTGDSKSVPPKFYQDTLDTETEEEKEKAENSSDASESPDINTVTEKENVKVEIMDAEEPHTLTVNGLKGVLCYYKRKGPKKSIKWKPDSELEEIQYFELDETERVNVTKNFTDMKYLERIHEREAFQKGRNLANEDIMGEKTMWAHLIPLDLDGQIEVEYGKLSKEKEIQAIRQKGTLQPLYFHKSMIPESPMEPDPETHTYIEPTLIPLEDVTGNQDNISDFRNMPWPEPKGNAPPTSNNVNVAPIFPSPFPNSFPPTPFPGVPGFQGPNMVPGDWPNGVPPHIMANGMPMPLPPGAMPPVNMPPGLMVPPENMMMGPEMFGSPNPLFPGPPDAFAMPQGMFPPEFSMSGPGGPPGPDGFPGPDSFPVPDGFPGTGNFRGPIRGRGTGGHWRGKNSGNWDGTQRGRGGGNRGSRKTVCIYFQRKGSCRQGDKCAFLHPGVNGPY